MARRVLLLRVLPEIQEMIQHMIVDMIVTIATYNMHECGTMLYRLLVHYSL